MRARLRRSRSSGIGGGGGGGKRLLRQLRPCPPFGRGHRRLDREPRLGSCRGRRGGSPHLACEALELRSQRVRLESVHLRHRLASEPKRQASQLLANGGGGGERIERRVDATTDRPSRRDCVRFRELACLSQPMGGGAPVEGGGGGAAGGGGATGGGGQPESLARRPR